MGFKHYSPSPMAAMADPWENVVERDIIHLDANHFIIDVSNSVLFLTGYMLVCYITYL